MARKTRLRYLRPAVLWREVIRARQRTELPMNSPRLTRSKEARQTERLTMLAPYHPQKRSDFDKKHLPMLLLTF